MIEFLAAMQVILLEDIEKLGNTGEMVTVKPGYARNFLLPKGYALFADDATIAEFEKRKEKLEAEAQERRVKAEATKESIEDSAVKVNARAGESGKLYGSITKEDMAQAIKEQLNLDIDKHKIRLKDNVNSIGDHKFQVGLGSGILVNLVLQVVAQD